MSNISGHVSRDRDVKEGKIKLNAFVVEHNLPMTHLPRLIRSVCKDSETDKGISCSKTKATVLIKKNVI